MYLNKCMIKKFKIIYCILLASSVSYGDVMMQGFYWDCPEGWYQTMQEKAHQLRYMKDSHGVNRIWFPPPQKSDFGTNSMGYDPYDYYDLGEFNQKGSISTRFGTKQDLIKTLKTYKDLGILCMVDLVLNHRSGGKLESNPNAKLYTQTDFSAVASKLCTWRYNQFHPSNYEDYDIGNFKSYPDICHMAANKKGDAGFDLIQWGKWLQSEIGFDGGWRFDYVKGINPSYIKSFKDQTGEAFSIIEYWDDDLNKIEAYAQNSGNPKVFDFPLFYKMVEVFNHQQDISQLVDTNTIYAARFPNQAVTFVANHDTDVDRDTFVESIDEYPMLAYAFILTYQGYPCLFWKDYFDRGLSNLGNQGGNGINALVWVREALINDNFLIENLKVDKKDVIAFGAIGDNTQKPGYISIINNSSSSKIIRVQTSNKLFKNKNLKCYAWFSYHRNKKSSDVFCSSMGWVKVKVPPKGYVVYSLGR